MPVLSYVHALFRVDQGHASIQTLRWQERPLPCPRCQSHDVDPWGTYHYRPGCKRYWCHGGKRTCNALTNALWHQRKRALPYGLVATVLWGLSCSSRRLARALGVHTRTS
jgi:transposase-like protein